MKDINCNNALLTSRLLQIIGSPMVPRTQLSVNEDEADDLYLLAGLNKIGCLYLNALHIRNLLGVRLEKKYQNEKNRLNDHQTTVSRVAEALNSQCIPYIIIKSVMSFPAIPNDVDILISGTLHDYINAINVLIKAEYSIIDEARVPFCIPFSDTHGEEYIARAHKGPFNIDLYEEVSAASHLIYLSKEKLKIFNTLTEVGGSNINLLNPEADLLVSIAHSVIEVQLYTLLVHYQTLFFLSNANFNSIEKLILLAKQNNVTYALKSHISLTIELERHALRDIPEKLLMIQEKLGINTREITRLRNNEFSVPHHYSLVTLAGSLIEKLKEGKFARSSVKQAICMLNPAEVKRVVSALFLRSKRETY